MNDYIAIIFGEFGDKRNVYELMLAITPVVESETLKFHYCENSILCHFQSPEVQEEIHQYFRSALYGLTDMIFISESSNLSFTMKDDLRKHLMDLSEAENPDMVIDMEKIRKGEEGFLEQDLINLPIIFDEDDEEDQIDMIRKKAKQPSLDELLEKIHIYGYDALSDTEIKLLNTYSN